MVFFINQNISSTRDCLERAGVLEFSLIQMLKTPMTYSVIIFWYEFSISFILVCACVCVLVRGCSTFRNDIALLTLAEFLM